MQTRKFVYQGTSKKGKKVIIRYVQKEDAQQLMEYINTLSQEQSYVRFQGETVSLTEEQEYLDKQLERIEKHVSVQLVVVYNKTLIGVSSVDMGDRIDKHVGSFGLSIDKQYRGEGFGKLLMDYTLKEAVKNMPLLRIITLGVFSNNALAIELYKKFGFQFYGSLPKGVLHKGVYVDHGYMYKAIKDD